jgi:hypothetical protein
MHRSSGQPRTWALAAVLLAGGIAAASPARAADVTDAQAQQLEQQVRSWLADLLGPLVHLADSPVKLTAEDDHFRAEIPLDDLFGGAAVSLTGGPITAQARPLDGDRWALDKIEFPSPLRIAYPMAGGGSTTVSYSFDEQTSSAVLDPSLATGSNFDSTLKGYAARGEGPQGTQSSRMEQLSNHLSWQPAEGGRVNMLGEADGKLLTVNSMAPKFGLVSFSAERMHGTVHLDNVAPDLLRPIIHAAFELVPVAMAAANAAAEAKPPKKAQLGQPGKPPEPHKPKPAAAHPPEMKLSPEMRASLREALTAARNLTDGFGEKVSLENVVVEAAGHGGHASRFEAGMGIAAPDGLLMLRINFLLDGLDSPEIPPGALHDYLPRHIAFAPRIGGIPAKDVMDLLILAVDSDGDDPVLQAKTDALMHKGPVAVGLDDLALDFGPVMLKGSGAMQIVDRTTYSGEAHFSATGMDEMIRQAGATPELQQAVPVLILLKGIGQQDGDKMVWNIAYQDGKLLVNGNDLSQMMPGK